MRNYGLRTIEEIEEIVPKLCKKGKKIVTTNGSFDIVHGAHVRLLEQAKILGDVLIVLLNNDDSIRRNKGKKRPIVSENERAYLVASLKPVDYVVIFPHDKPLEYLARIKPHIHVKGGSWVEERMREEKELLAQWGGSYHLFQLEETFSTTDIIERIAKKYR